MRIVAGASKGRRLAAPAGDDVRPTADRVKEALFASLQPMLVGARVLDLYAGSGALGLEALSRGASNVTFVEADRRALDVIRRNVEAVGLPGARILAQRVSTALADTLDDAPFDLVVADPPYRLPRAELEEILVALIGHLAPGALVVVERSARDGGFAWPPPLEVDGDRRYGDTTLRRARQPAER